MTPYFYLDHIAACWMADKFGMKFALPDDDEHPYCSGGFIGVTMWDGDKILGSRSLHSEERLYIHEGPINLIVPQVGDLCKHYAGDKCSFGIICWNSSGNPIGGRTEIIQRNNTHFMWPEIEP